MLPLIAILFVGGIVALVAGAGSKGGGAASNALISGHRYKGSMRTDVKRAGATFAQMETLTTRLAQLGWTSVFLEPNDADADPFVWEFDAIWSGAKATLADGLGLFFITHPDDVTVRADHHGKYDDDLPPDLEETVTRMLGFESDPIKLFDFAQQLRPQFPIAAGALETKAATLNFGPSGPPASPPASPPATPPAATPDKPAPQPTNLKDPPLVTPQQVQPTPIVQPPAPPPPPDPVQPDPTPAFTMFDPGPLPRLPAIPASGGNKTAAHASVQKALKNFFDNNNVMDPTTQDNFFFGRGAGDIDGLIGPNTQKALWAFQRFQNKTNGFALTEDGLPGASTNQVLQQFGFDPSASSSPSTFTENDA